jgi:hypothetical protein
VSFLFYQLKTLTRPKNRNFINRNRVGRDMQLLCLQIVSYTSEKDSTMIKKGVSMEGTRCDQK